MSEKPYKSEEEKLNDLTLELYDVLSRIKEHCSLNSDTFICVFGYLQPSGIIDRQVLVCGEKDNTETVFNSITDKYFDETL